MQVLTRLAGLGDIPRIVELYELLFSEMAALQPAYWQAWGQGEEFLAGAMESDLWEIFVAEQGGVAAGFAVVKETETPPYRCFVPHRYAYLMDLVVEPSSRGCGLGRLLIGEVERWAQARNLDYVELQVLEENQRAADLYEQCGFTTTTRVMRRALR